MPPHLSLQFLGPPQIRLDDAPILPERRSVIALLAYLAVNKSPRHSREFLSSLFWSEYNQTKAFTNLRHTLWEIHKSIGEGWIISDRTTVSLNPEADISFDVTRFQDSLNEARHQNDITLRTALLADTVSIYRNHFLTGFSLRDAPEFNEWTFTQSESLRNDLASALTLLVDSYLAQGKPAFAIPHARRLISLDPLNESAHCQLIEVYLQAGQHAAAWKQYQTCEQILRTELGVEPQSETLALYKRIHKVGAKVVQIEKQVQTDTPRHNLPIHLTSFIGREKERDEICKLLNKNRLVTLLGAGGIGKTRLAIQAGEILLQAYPDGVWFVGLESIIDPSLIPQTVAEVFEIRNIASHSIMDRLIDALKSRNVLLILDNCEHLLTAAAQLVETLLKHCPELIFLATSRVALGMDGETLYQVPSLSVPQNLATNNLDEFESIKLFSERAVLAVHTFTLNKKNIDSVTSICQLVDGIPLAIELASARVDILTPQEILEQLKKSFALLAHRGRAPVARHQSMRASMDWSWGLLTEQEQVFLARLSVFAGGWTLEAAQVVCVDKEVNIESVLELTGSLVKKSLVVVEQVEGRVTRYRLHEIVRQYAREKLAEEEDVRSRHLKYYVVLAKDAEIALRGLESGKWMDRLIEERGNLFAALEWAEKTDLEAGLRLSARLQRYWEIMDIHSGEGWLSRFIGKDGSEHFPIARAKALCARANLHVPLAQHEHACSDAEEGLNLFKANGDAYGEVDCLLVMALIGSYRYDPSSKKELAKRALEISRSLGDSWRQAMSLNILGWTCNDQRQREYWEKSITLLRKVGDYDHLFIFLNDLANYEYSEGNYELAHLKFEELLQLSQSIRLNTGLANAIYARSIMALMNGDFDKARAFLDDCVELMDRIGDRMNNTWLRVRTGHVSVLQGEFMEARVILSQGAHDFHADKSENGLAFTFEGMANLCVRIGKYEQAAHLVGFADAARKRVGDNRPHGEQADIDRIISACLFNIGEEIFSDAYDEGQKMTMDEAVAFALTVV